MDSRPRRPLQCLPRAFDVLLAGPRQPGDDWPPDRCRNRLNRLEIAVRGNREPSFDYVHAEPVELLRHAQLLVDVHAATRRLLAIAQRGIEDRDSYSFHGPGSSLGYGHPWESPL